MAKKKSSETIKKTSKEVSSELLKKLDKKSARNRGRDAAELKNFKLGESHTAYHSTYSPDLLEAFDNKHPTNFAWTTFICTEFTSLCPKTGQPDFAKIFINYIADEKMVESKSLKLYLFSFRNHGDFHEDCVQKMCNDIADLIKPHYIEVVGEFTPRGGIAIFPFASHASSHKKFQDLASNRFMNYAPGKYSMELAKLY